MYRRLFPNDPEPPRAVRVGVVRSTALHTNVVTLDIPKQHWTFITSRLPTAWAVSTLVTITFTPMELEYLQGKRELQT